MHRPPRGVGTPGTPPLPWGHRHGAGHCSRGVPQAGTPRTFARRLDCHLLADVAAAGRGDSSHPEQVLLAPVQVGDAVEQLVRAGLVLAGSLWRGTGRRRSLCETLSAEPQPLRVHPEQQQQLSSAHTAQCRGEPAGVVIPPGSRADERTDGCSGIPVPGKGRCPGTAELLQGQPAGNPSRAGPNPLRPQREAKGSPKPRWGHHAAHCPSPALALRTGQAPGTVPITAGTKSPCPKHDARGRTAWHSTLCQHRAGMGLHDPVAQDGCI